MVSDHALGRSLPQEGRLSIRLHHKYKPELVLLAFHSGQNAAINSSGPAAMKIDFIPCDASCARESQLT